MWQDAMIFVFFLYSSSVYSCHLFLISSASVKSIPFLSFIEPTFAWNVPLVSLIFFHLSREDCFSTAGYIYHCSPSAPCGPWTQTWPWLLTLPLTSWVFLARYLSSLCHTGSQMLPVRAILCFHFLILKLLCQNLIQKAELRLLPFVPRILGNISSGAQIYLFALDTQNEAAECFSPLLNYTSVYAANQ